ncbi:MAG: hypothetical protein AAF411_11930 [Myxococcota bacterium]
MGGAAIGGALLGRLHEGDPTLQNAAWQGLLVVELPDALLENARAAAGIALADEAPTIRLAAFTLLGLAELDPEVLARALRDPDALIRAAAVTHLTPHQTLDYISDSALAVRTAAARQVLRDPSCLPSAVDRLLTAERTDTLSQLLVHPNARCKARAELNRDGIAPRKVLVLLESFAKAKA